LYVTVVFYVVTWWQLYLVSSANRVVAVKTELLHQSSDCLVLFYIHHMNHVNPGKVFLKSSVMVLGSVIAFFHRVKVSIRAANSTDFHRSFPNLRPILRVYEFLTKLLISVDI